jgi:hypothetical protein
LNGRSARAGALSAADFFSGRADALCASDLSSGNGNEALSSLMAAAGGGVTVETQAMIESGEVLENDKCRGSTTPENRMPICADRRGGAAISFILRSELSRQRTCAVRCARLEGWATGLMVRDGADAPPHHEELR